MCLYVYCLLTPHMCTHRHFFRPTTSKTRTGAHNETRSMSFLDLLEVAPSMRRISNRTAPPFGPCLCLVVCVVLQTNTGGVWFPCFVLSEDKTHTFTPWTVQPAKTTKQSRSTLYNEKATAVLDLYFPLTLAHTPLSSGEGHRQVGWQDDVPRL